jgi:quercetin dioxygenase-like cupin family protein
MPIIQREDIPTMNSSPFVVPPTKQPPALNVLGVNVTVLASNIQTEGYEITLQSGGYGVGPPPHWHDWDESFYVLRGSVEMFLEGHAIACPAGTLVHVPARTVHGFNFGTEGGELIEITSAGGRAAQMFDQVSREIPPGAPDLPKAIAVLAKNGVMVA